MEKVMERIMESCRFVGPSVGGCKLKENFVSISYETEKVKEGLTHFGTYFKGEGLPSFTQILFD